jgi:hypothetical protein
MTQPRDPVTGSDELSPKQLEAINLLYTGKTKVATAEAIKVHRVTLSNWFRKDPRFRAELNRRLHDRAEATRVRVQSLVETSLDVLEESITRDRDPKAAGAFLRLVGSQGFLGAPPAGPATFEEAALQMVIDDEHQNTLLKVVRAKTEPPRPRPNLVDTIASRTGETARQHPESGNGKAQKNRDKNSERSVS